MSAPPYAFGKGDIKLTQGEEDHYRKIEKKKKVNRKKATQAFFSHIIMSTRSNKA